VSAALDLFAGLSMQRPAQAHETSVIRNPDGSKSVRVRLRITGEAHEERLPEGPLTYAECREWVLPCQLYSCRHRLDDAIELRTRRGDEPGDWCALRVAERGGDGRVRQDGLSLKELGDMHGLTRDACQRSIVEPAIDAYYAADLALDDTAGDMYGDEGRHHQFKFEADDSTLTSNEAKRAVVPGEETCRCASPSGERGAICATCGIRIKRGRQAPRVRGWRKPRKDRWAGVTRVIPAQLAHRVDTRLMNPTQAPEIPKQFIDINAMIAARKATAKKDAA
jgi:hypothetical protein